MFCHVLLRSPRSTTAHLSGTFSNCLKICLATSLSTPFLYVVLRPRCFVHGGRNRDCRGRRGHCVNVALVTIVALVAIVRLYAFFFRI